MKWNGTVSHSGTSAIAARFASENSDPRDVDPAIPVGPLERVQSASMRYPTPRSVTIAVGAELRPQPTDVHVDDVRSRIEVVAPHRRQQPLLRDRAARVAHQLAQQQELAIRQRAPARRRRRPAGGSHRATGPWPPDGSGSSAARSAAVRRPARAAPPTRTASRCSPPRPARGSCTFEAVSFSADSTSTCCSGRRSRSRWRTSCPSMPGITRSRITRS